MPDIETTCRYQKAILWSKTGVDNYGEVLVSSPVEIEVRWENKQQDALDKNGATISIDAMVVVNQEIEVGSAMWLGELTDWYGTGSAGDNSDVMQVVMYSTVPDLKNRYTRRTVGLKFYKDNPPTLG